MKQITREDLEFLKKEDLIEAILELQDTLHPNEK